MRKVSAPVLLLTAVLLLVIAGYILYPVWATVWSSVSAESGVSMTRYLTLLDPSNSASWEAVWNSVLVSVMSVVFSAVVGTLFALVLTQMRFPGRALISRLSVLPIALPPLVGVISFMFVFGESGFLPRVLQNVLRSDSVPLYLDGMSAIVAVHVYSFYVYFYLFISNALVRLDSSLIEAATGLGSGWWMTFRRVILPELRPSYTGASILTFMASMASFSAPFLFGGGKRFMTVEIYSAKLNGDMGIAAAESIMLMLVSVGFFLFLKFSGEPGASSIRRSKGTARSHALRFPGWLRWTLLGAFAVVFVMELLPIITIFLLSFAREGSWTWQIFPTGFGVENYTRLLDDPHIARPIENSIIMSLLSLLVCVIVGVAAAYVIVKGRVGRAQAVFDAVVTFPFAIPGTIVAISLILAFNVPSFLTGYTVLVGSFWILPMAYAIRTYPLVVRSTSAALSQLDDSLLEASYASGAGFWRGFRKVVLPLITPGIVSGALLVAIASLGEFVSSILLYTYASRPISVEILSQLRSYNFGGAAAYCVVLLGIITGLVYLSNVVIRRVRRDDAEMYF
ncbi:MAG: iron ABC transporter permease [Ignavibacteria bacterium]|nr:iron ABC transporter permease [Ignavibacteria bacterium]